MTTQAIISLLILSLILAAVIFRVAFWPGIRTRRIQQRPFPESWQQTLNDTLPFLARLPPAQQEQLQLLIKVFLADKDFYVCAGQEINDDIRVTIAAQACLLILNQDRTPYPDLDSILVYPSYSVILHRSSVVVNGKLRSRYLGARKELIALKFINDAVGEDGVFSLVSKLALLIK